MTLVWGGGPQDYRDKPKLTLRVLGFDISEFRAVLDWVWFETKACQDKLTEFDLTHLQERVEVRLQRSVR